MVTFAVLGHNESGTLPTALGQAREACRAGDRVLFVDSASTDDSASVARELGVEVLAAPLGKGAAMAAAFGACESSLLCLMDADIYGADRNIAATLRAAILQQRVDMLVADFTAGGILSNTLGVYDPLVEAFFPEAAGRFGTKPLSGFRILDARQPFGALPAGFGVEAHLNVVAAADGLRVGVADVGAYRGRFLYKPRMGFEIASAVLDEAGRRGRVTSELRRQWESWVAGVVDVIASFRGDPADAAAFERRLEQVRNRPRPAAGAAVDGR